MSSPRHAFGRILAVAVLSAPALATLPPAAEAAAPPVALWGGVSTGMSGAQVRALYPRAGVLADPAADAGYLTTLATSVAPVQGHPTTALFRFHSGRLFSVRLNIGGLRPGRSADNRRFADAVIAGYSHRLPAYDCADNTRADVHLLDCKWLDHGTSIRLEYMDVAGQAPTLKVLFDPVSDVGSDL